MYQKSIKILVVGAGSIGTRHIRNLQTLGYKNLAVFDPDPKARERVAALVPASSHSDLAAAFRKEKPSVVFICSPTDLHIKHLHMALRHGADVFLEKPLSHNFQGVGEAIKESKKKKRVVMVACNYRFHKGWQKLQEIIANRSFGRPIFCRVAMGYYLPQARPHTNFREIYAVKKQGGGVILDSGSHAVDYLRFLGGEVKRGFIFTSRLHPLGIEKEEVAALFLEYSNGITAAVSMDYISRKPTHRIEVITNKGLLTLDFKGDVLTFQDDGAQRTLYRGKGDSNQVFIDEIVHFLECVDKRKKPVQDLEEAKKVTEVLLKSRRMI